MGSRSGKGVGGGGKEGRKEGERKAGICRAKGIGWKGRSTLA